jgi:hypothetical protein
MFFKYLLLTKPLKSYIALKPPYKSARNNTGYFYSSLYRAPSLTPLSQALSRLKLSTPRYSPRCVDRGLKKLGRDWALLRLRSVQEGGGGNPAGDKQSIFPFVSAFPEILCLLRSFLLSLPDMQDSHSQLFYVCNTADAAGFRNKEVCCPGRYLHFAALQSCFVAASPSGLVS